MDTLTFWVNLTFLKQRKGKYIPTYSKIFCGYTNKNDVDTLTKMMKWRPCKYEPAEDVMLSNKPYYVPHKTVEGKDHKVKSKIFGPFGQILANFSSFQL